LQPPREFARIGQLAGVDDAEQRHFRRLAWVGRSQYLGMAFEQQLPEPMQRRKTEPTRPFRISLAFLDRERQILSPACLGAGDAVDDFQQPAQHRHRLDTERILPLGLRQHIGDIGREQGGEHAPHRTAVGQAEHVAYLTGRYAAAVHIGMRDRLVEDRLAIARRAFRRARDQRQRLRLGLHAFVAADESEILDQFVGRDALQIETLTTRQHRNRHLVHLGGGEQEFHVRRRLLQRLEQPVESRLRQHVNFVDDVDLVARRHRRIAHRFDDLADIVDAGVAGGVHLDHVDVPALGDRYAGLAHTAGIDRRPARSIGADAVQRLGNQPRGRGLADPPHAGEEKRMGQPIALDRVGQRLDHRILADQLREALGAIFAGEDAIGLLPPGLGRFAKIEGIGHGPNLVPHRPGWKRRTPPSMAPAAQIP